MKNITLSADERLIESARTRARREHTTLNEQFRNWLAAYSGDKVRTQRALETIEAVSGQVRIGRKLTRDEMNER